MIVDIHSDVVIDVFARRQRGERAVLKRHHLPKWRAGGVGGALCTVGGDPASLTPLGEGRAYASALAQINVMRKDIAESKGEIAVCQTAEELERLLVKGAFAVMFVLEGALPLGEELGRIGELHALGVRVIGLTWNSRNALATGIGCGDGGLTRHGALAVAEMNELGVTIDLAHASPRTYWDVLEATRAPVIVSHANARSLCDHPRNLADRQLDGLRDNGGVVGVVLYPDFVVAEAPTREAVLDQLEFLMNRVGNAGVAIGADFIDYAGPALLADLEAVSASGDALPAFPAGLADTSTLDSLLAGLAARGHGPDVVSGIASGNFLAVLRAVEAAARRPAERQ